MEHPKVFVSHASKDKERFVLEFATKLRANGIDAKVDQWEILPGDSLVDKIFEEGIGEAQAVIIVVSEHSVDRAWVREELNAATVRRIEGASKLIPVVIGNVDDSQVPVSLKAVAWQRIENLDNYDAELNRVILSIYGQYEKPPIGESPAFTRSTIAVVPGLNEVDSLVLQFCCQEIVDRDQSPLRFKPQEVYEALEPQGIHQDNVLETLHLLDGRGYLHAQTTISGAIYDFTITDYGFEEYLRANLPDYDSLDRAVALQIANFGERTSRQLAQSLNQPIVVVEHVLGVLAGRGFIVTQTSPMLVRISRVTPELKRWLEET